jgi:hypothetical protein
VIGNADLPRMTSRLDATPHSACQLQFELRHGTWHTLTLVSSMNKFVILGEVFCLFNTVASSIVPLYPHNSSIPKITSKSNNQTIKMFHRRRPATTTTRESKPSLMTRLRGPGARKQTIKTKTTTTRHKPATTTRHAPATTTRHGPSTHRTSRRHMATTTPQHHRRKVTMGDKVSGAMLKLKGSLTHRPALKVCLSSSRFGDVLTNECRLLVLAVCMALMAVAATLTECTRMPFTSS